MKILFYLALISILHIPYTRTMLENDYELEELVYNQIKLLKKKSYLSQRPTNTYNPTPSDNNAPLDATHVLNDFWKSLAGYPTALINDEFKKAAMYYGGDPNYTIRRYHIAAAVLTGADPNLEIDIFSHINPLYDAALHQDYPAVRILTNP